MIYLSRNLLVCLCFTVCFAPSFGFVVRPKKYFSAHHRKKSNNNVLDPCNPASSLFFSTSSSGSSGGGDDEKSKYFSVQLNEFFKKPVPAPIKRSLSLYMDTEPTKCLDAVSIITAAPCNPGCPRPLWIVILASVPTGLLWVCRKKKEKTLVLKYVV